MGENMPQYCRQACCAVAEEIFYIPRLRMDSGGETGSRKAAKAGRGHRPAK